MRRLPAAPDLGERTVVGTGLGLDVSYRIVVGRHGGDISVVTRPGETRFEVRLPVEGPVGDGAPIDAGRSVRADG